MSRRLPRHAEHQQPRPCDASMWRKFIASPDTLRQRVDACAVSSSSSSASTARRRAWRQFFAAAAYVDMLERHAFGNFRSLLLEASRASGDGPSTSPSSATARRTRPPARVPDENYARELMQLFTIGLLELNMRRHACSVPTARPIETYTQDDITGLARVFTGWNLANPRQQRRRRDRQAADGQHRVAARNRREDLPRHHHPGRHRRAAQPAPRARRDLRPSQRRRPSSRSQLIQRLVTSQSDAGLCRPDRGGVRQQRQPACAATCGGGPRRSCSTPRRATMPSPAAPSYGKLREPILRLHRLGARVRRHVALGRLGDRRHRSTRATGSARARGRAQRLQLLPPRLRAAQQRASPRAGLVAPEFQITNEPSVIAYVNYMAALVVGRHRRFPRRLYRHRSRSPPTARRWSTRSTSCSARACCATHQGAASAHAVDVDRARRPRPAARTASTPRRCSLMAAPRISGAEMRRARAMTSDQSRAAPS